MPIPFFKNWFFRGFKKHPFNWETLSMEDLSGHPDGLHDIFCRKTDGFLIRQVLSPVEVGRVLAGLKSLDESEFTFLPNGMVFFPPSFAQMNPDGNASKEKIEKKFQLSKDWRVQFPELFGLDLEQRILKVFKKLAGNREVIVPVGPGGKGSLLPGNFRRLIPGEGFFNIHCGNLFHEEFEHFYKFLNNRVSVFNQLSYFILLQKPEQGGELTIYDLEWGNVQTRLDGGRILKSLKGESFEPENPKKVRRKEISPDVGDMVLFAGGEIWHKVELVKGANERITFGGFLAFSHQGDQVYFWT